MSVTLREREFESFFEVPFAVYGADTPHVSPLKGDLKAALGPRNPLFRDWSELTYWTAHRQGAPVGRITAHIHAESNDLHGEARGCFGFFDCADDPDAARLLLGAAEDWCRARGMTRLVGNFNLTAMQQIGVVTEGFVHAPYLDQVWNPAHIPALLKANGFTPEFPMTTFVLDLDTAPEFRVGPKQEAVLDDPDYAFRPITRRNLASCLDDVRVILNASFAENPMFVPLTKAEFDFQVAGLKFLLDPRLSAIVHHRGRPAACVVAIPDANPLLKRIGSRLGLHMIWPYLRFRITNRRAVAIIAGVIPELQNTGVTPVLLAQILSAMKTAGFRTMANTWIADENVKSLAMPQKLGSTRQHRVHLFAKDL